MLQLGSKRALLSELRVQSHEAELHFLGSHVCLHELLPDLCILALEPLVPLLERLDCVLSVGICDMSGKERSSALFWVK